MKEILIAISGTILFLIGMVRLSSAVRSLINARIKEYVKYAVNTPVYGLITGIVAAIIFQSSSAATALTVGLVSTGLINFYSSLAIILGADIGTTLTVQFVIWRFTEFSPVFISIGGLLWLTSRDRWKVSGEMIFYFGLIFFGLDVVSQTVSSLKNSPAFLNFFVQTKNPLVGIGLGIVVTGIIQASAIPIGILALLAQQDLVSLDNALPIILGANIGTTVTALLVGTVSTIGGRRTAFSHLIFKCAGVLVCLLFLSYLTAVLKAIPVSTAQQIALAHFLLNLVIVVLFIFFLRPFAGLMNRILPGEDEALPVWPEYLDRRDLVSPQKSLDNVQRELHRQAMLAQKMFSSAVKQLESFSEGRRRDISYIEIIINNLRAQVVRFLRKIAGRELSSYLSKKLLAYTAMADDIQSIGSHIERISHLTMQKSIKKIEFSTAGEKEMEEILVLVTHNLDEAASLLEIFSDDKITEIIRREDEIDNRVKEAHNSHLDRFHNRLCSAEAGPIFVEMLIHLERISDLCTNIAEYVLDIKEDKMNNSQF
jgi:phosphate:Na+ symporter